MTGQTCDREVQVNARVQLATPHAEQMGDALREVMELRRRSPDAARIFDLILKVIPALNERINEIVGVGSESIDQIYLKHRLIDREELAARVKELKTGDRD